MVGDRVDTDILFGNRGGLLTLLVLTGVTKREEVAGLEGEDAPGFVLQSFGDLAPLAQGRVGSDAV